MTRWQPDAQGRLERAAIELFTEQGFAATTVPQIAARAGLTTRTFFRYFPDKREVLFAFEAELPAIVAGVLEDAPADRAPMAVIAAGLESLATSWFQPMREHFVVHAAIVRSDPGLGERELRKRTILADAIREGFVARGEDALTAAVVADMAVTAFSVAIETWLDGDAATPFVDVVRATLARTRAVAATL